MPFQPNVLHAQVSPLGAAMQNLTRAFFSGPSAEERDARRAQVDALTARADKSRAETESIRSQQNALSGVGATIADLMAPHQAPRPAPDFVGPLPVEAPEQRASRIAPGLAQLFASLGKDVAAATQAGLASANAYGGPDDLRRALVLQGKAPGKYGMTAEENNAFSARDAAEDRAKALAVQTSTPYTLSPGSVRFGPDNTRVADNPAAPSTPRNYYVGNQVFQTYDGVTDARDGSPLPSGGVVASGMVNAKEPGALTPANKTKVQSGLMDLGTYGVLSNQYRQYLDANPNAVGTKGNVARFADSIIGQVKSLGAQDSEIGAQIEATMSGLQNAVGGGGDGDLYNAATVAALLPFTAAAAITGQSGRALSDQDRKIVEKAAGSPEDWLATPEKLRARLDTLDSIVEQMRRKYQGDLGGTPAPAPAAAPPASAPTPETVLQEARDAIARGAPAAAVQQRLREMGIDPRLLGAN